MIFFYITKSSFSMFYTHLPVYSIYHKLTQLYCTSWTEVLQIINELSNNIRLQESGISYVEDVSVW